MSNIKTQWQDLLKRDMTRKEFLGMLGLGALILLNIEPLLRLFGHGSKYPPVNGGYSSDGYSGFIGSRPPQGGKGFDD